MRKPWRMLIVPFLLLVILQSCSISAVSASTADSSANDWPMFRKDQSHSGYASGSGPANSARLLWTWQTRQAVWSSPAVVNGHVFVGCKDTNVYCLNASHGELLWNYSTGGEVNSSPAISNEHVYIGSDDGHVYCLNAATGMLLWRTAIGGWVRSSPAVVDARVYVGSGARDFFCLNATDGTIIWRHPTLFRVHSSPAVSNGIVYFACDDYSVHAVNASTGGEIWQRHTGSNLNSPTVYDGRIYTGGYTGYVYCLDAYTGNEVWKFRTEDSLASSPAVAYGCVYIGGEDNSVYCLNASTGNMIWKTSTGYWVWSSPTVSDGNVFVGSEDYNIYCLNASTGAKKWSYETECYVDSSPTIVNGVLYVGSHDYHVYALALSEIVDLPPLDSHDLLPWTTIVFDAIACSVAAVIVLAFLRFVQSTRRNIRKLEGTENSRRRSWFFAHADALCVFGILASSILFLLNLGTGFLWGTDEQTYSQMAYHMVKNGDYLTPWAFGDYAIWTGKPPLVMWLMSLSFQVFGVNNFAARLPSAVFGAFSLVLVYFLGKKLYNAPVGILSALVLGTFATFYEFATHAMLDLPFVFFTIASIYFMVLSEGTKNVNRYAVLSGLFFACSLLTKLVQALLIPLIILTYLIITRRSVKFLFTKRTAFFLGIPLLILIPWLLYMDQRFYGDFWQCYFVYTGLTRIVSPLEGHPGGYLFYFNYLVNNENLLWVVLLPFSVGLCTFNSVVRRVKEDTLVLAWMIVVLLVFTFAQTKLYWYVLPALPAFAISISSFLVKLAKRTQRPRRPISS